VIVFGILAIPQSGRGSPAQREGKLAIPQSGRGSPNPRVREVTGTGFSPV